MYEKKIIHLQHYVLNMLLNLKLPLVMRISLALLFAVVLQLSAEDGYAQRTRVAISMNNVSVEQVLNKIEETSDYVFLYNDKTIQKNRIVSVRNNSGKILDILDEVFKRNQHYLYSG